MCDRLDGETQQDGKRYFNQLMDAKEWQSTSVTIGTAF